MLEQSLICHIVCNMLFLAPSSILSPRSCFNFLVSNPVVLFLARIWNMECVLWFVAFNRTFLFFLFSFFFLVYLKQKFNIWKEKVHYQQTNSLPNMLDKLVLLV